MKTFSSKTRNAVQEGFDNIELLKRYTVGMGQPGKHSNMNALRILARVTGKSPGEVAQPLPASRSSSSPVALSRTRLHERQTPLHSRHAALGPVHACWRLAKTGVLRPTWKSWDNCICREAEAVRTRVGVIDVGTLGKLNVGCGGRFERVYTGRHQ